MLDGEEGRMKNCEGRETGGKEGSGRGNEGNRKEENWAAGRSYWGPCWNIARKAASAGITAF